ncbi:MAG: 2-C-methyl-D-erythritol 4-phosphate cytidylyltransferase [Oscillatoriales cyanobacterium]|nr:MAG: 2-C-methyl-D-erythritol 4-phosphate cytidylyltransferase [Oscillatoriales cyanobacterium]
MHLLIPAAGSGRRMGSQRNKLLLTLLEKPLLSWTLAAAEASQQISWIGIMGQPEDFPDFKAILGDLALLKPVELIQGGATRQESVYNGLQALPPNADRVLIHDGARCLATPELFDRSSAALLSCPGLIVAVPVKDTIKVVDESRIVRDTPDRSHLWAAQTPQGLVTDDAALFEKCGLPVQIVEGEETNLKVTTPVDLALAEFILRQRTDKSK